MARSSSGQQPGMRSTGLTETRSLYHRQTVDEALADDVLELLEHSFAQLSENYDWGVVVYLLYGNEDHQAFERWEVNSELKLSISAQFAKEAEAEMRRQRASGPAEDYCLKKWGYSLSADEHDGPIRCRLRRSYSRLGRGWSSADVDIVFSETDAETASVGRLNAIVRAWPVMKDRDPVRFVLDCRGGLISPHVDLSQRRARGRLQQVYVTRDVTDLCVGAGLGCDVLIPALNRATHLSVRDAKLWVGQQNVGTSWNGEGFSLNLNTMFGGETFGELVQTRTQTHDLYLRVIGRVLPRKEGDGIGGYAKDWCNVRAQTGRPIQVSVPLSEGFAIAVDDEGVVFVWGSGNRLAMELGSANTPFRVGSETYTWEPDPTNVFWGSLYFESDSRSGLNLKRQATIPAERKLAGMVTRSAPEKADVLPLLTDYDDDELLSKRGSVQVDSDGAGPITISVADSSPLRRFFVFERQAWRCYENQAAVIASFEATPSHKFVFGSSLFMVSANGNSYHLRPHWSGNFDILTENTRSSADAYSGD